MRYLKKSGRENTGAADKTDSLRKRTAEIIDEVASGGASALRRLAGELDGSRRASIAVSREEIARARASLPAEELRDMERAAANIRRFAEAQMRTLSDLPSFEPSPGVRLGHRLIPVRSCLCYVPGGRYPLYSTALMLAAPAKAAGVPRVAAASPVARGTDSINPRTLAALDIAGADEVYAVGGAHAIAAFAYGTEDTPPVDMIVGPGNAWVTEAKRQCFGRVGIDFVAGPSEVLIIADATADAEIIAADLLAQSEHDVNASGILITTDEALGRAVIEAVERQLAALPTEGTARPAWEANGEVLAADSLAEAAEAANDRAPEHLELQLADPEAAAAMLYNYGSLFIGECAAEVFGDYASGPNHTLPTMRAARYTGGVWAGTFLKTCTHQSMTREAMADMAPLVARMARGEGLEAHARAAEIRAERLTKG